MEDLQCLGPEKPQSFEGTTGSVDMEQIAQETGLGMSRFHCDGDRGTDPADDRVTGPHFQLRDNAEALAQLQYLAIAFGGDLDVYFISCSDSGRWGRDSFSSDSGQKIHIPLELFQPGGASLGILDQPGRESDGTFHGEA